MMQATTAPNTSSHRPIGDGAVDSAPLRIAYYRECVERPGLDPEVKAHVLAQVARLKEQGHTVEPIELPMLDHLVPTYYILATAEASSNLARFDGIRYGHRSKEASGVDDTYRRSRSEGFGAEVKRRILLGTFVLSAGYYDAYYAQGMRVRRLIRDNTLKAFERFDLILTPTCPSTAFAHGAISDPVSMYLQDIFTVQANLAGIPAISVPTGTPSHIARSWPCPARATHTPPATGPLSHPPIACDRFWQPSRLPIAPPPVRI